jgi:F0F1-type ATP synthase epsilon subunit
MMQVTIRYIDKTLFQGQVDEVILPGLYGKIGVKPHHAMMSVILSAGEISVKSANHDEKFTITEGIAHVSNNTVDVLLAA